MDEEQQNLVEAREEEEPEDGSEEESFEEAEDESRCSPEQLLAMGKKSLAANDPSTAVDSLQEACSILAEIHGQVDKELAEPYYLYGKALLELYRDKSAVFGKGLPVSGEAKENLPTGECSNGDGTTSSSTDDAKARPNKPAEPVEEEESDLELSWQILELARIICHNESDKLKLSDVHLALGEVGLESDQYEQAITDFQASLRLREFVLEPTDRRIAEVHFSLGLAYSLMKKADEACEAYNSAKTVLLKRKEQLEALDSKNEATQREIKELEDLIPDIDSKIDDAKELKKIGRGSLGEEEETCGFDSPQEKQEKQEAPAIDISHLVRKRKSCDGDNVSNNVPTKKLCSEDDAGGSNPCNHSDISPPQPSPTK